MNYGVVFAKESNAVRRIIVSDDPDYDYAVHVGDGEDHIVADARDGTDVLAARAAVEAATGRESPVPLVAVVDSQGVVAAMMLADPTLDSVKGHTLVAAFNGVEVGAIYDAKAATFTLPEKMIPAGVDKLGQTIAAKRIPATTLQEPVEAVAVKAR